MTASARTHVEPQGPAAPVSGTGPSDALAPALALVRSWAGDGMRAIVLSGSHAAGEAVWLRTGGQAWTPSDLDVYVVMRDAAACAGAEAREAAGRPGLAARLSAWGIEAPLEVAFVREAAWPRLPARPGTIELRRHGAVVAGDASLLARLPRWEARDVGAEERLLLLENRAHELLFALPDLASADGRAALVARHATLKAAADLAGALALASGEWPDGTAARIAWARERLAAVERGLPSTLAGAPSSLPALWDAALEWRAGRPAARSPAEARAEWRAAVRAWCAVWWRLAPAARETDPWTRVCAVASRAPLRRRLRHALAGGPEPAAGRLRHALAGTPAHRVHGSAAALLFAAALAPGEPALPAGALRALGALGITRAREFAHARAEVFAAWDREVLGGRRGGPSA